MKKRFTKFLSLVFALVLLFALTACDSKLNAPNETSDIDGNIPTEKHLWLPSTAINYEEGCKYTYDYNEYGNVIKTTKKNLNGNLKAVWLYEYDNNQNLIKRSVDTGDGSPFVQLIQTFDDHRRMVEQHNFTTSGETVYTFQYDAQDRLISKSYVNELLEIYTYNEDGSYMAQSANDAEEYSLYGADGKIKERHFAPNMKWVYSYTADGFLKECIAYSGEEITNRTVNDLDENGNIITVTEVSASGTERILGEYEYQLYTVKVK